MILFPAIDLQDGKCVRLRRGDFSKVTVFSDDPAAQAASFAEQGAEWLHVVDLDGAYEGRPVNTDAIKGILDAVDIPIQLGGGMRGLNMAETWINAGASRIILGTAAQRRPELVKEVCGAFPGKVAVGIDAKRGRVAVEGWSETSDMAAVDLARKFEDAGVAAIIYTNIDKDGMMQGPDVEGTKALAESISTPVIASGGVSSIEDLQALKAIEASGVMGVIAGRAVYDGKVAIGEAVELLR